MAENTSPRKVHLDLEHLERESVLGLPEAKRDPFVVSIPGRTVEFRDAIELNHLLLAQMEQTPLRFFKAAIAKDEDYKAFVQWANSAGPDGKAGLSGFKMRALMDGYRDYYGLDKAGNVLGS